MNRNTAKRCGLRQVQLSTKPLRISGELVSDDRREAKKHMLDAYPTLRNMYNEDDDNTEVFYFKNATATFSSFTEAPKMIKL